MWITFVAGMGECRRGVGALTWGETSDGRLAAEVGRRLINFGVGRDLGVGIAGSRAMREPIVHLLGRLRGHLWSRTRSDQGRGARQTAVASGSTRAGVRNTDLRAWPGGVVRTPSDLRREVRARP
ncbi:hypothetical protein GCM10010483_29930 [Actinokineospora diospyrosa]